MDEHSEKIERQLSLLTTEIQENENEDEDEQIIEYEDFQENDLDEGYIAKV